MIWPRCPCGVLFEPRPKGSPGPAHLCRSCARLCRACGEWFESTLAERQAQARALRRNRKRPAHQLPDHCPTCRPVARPAGVVTPIAGRKKRAG
jgi:hypothetical protein